MSTSVTTTENIRKAQREHLLPEDRPTIDAPAIDIDPS